MIEVLVAAISLLEELHEILSIFGDFFLLKLSKASNFVHKRIYYTIMSVGLCIRIIISTIIDTV